MEMVCCERGNVNKRKIIHTTDFAMFNKFPKRSGIYRINDNIKELQLCLHFRHINSLLKLPKFEFDLSKNGPLRRMGESVPPSAGDDIHKVNIKWQQKVLSASELELYSNESNCHNDRQRRYHDWIRNGGGVQLSVDDDNSLRKLSEREQKGSGSKPKSRLKRNKKVEKLNHLEEKASDQTQYLIFTYIDEDNHTPYMDTYKEQTLKTHAAVATEYMYIYAALQQDTLLITMRWYAEDRTLHIYPDFTNFQENPYFIEIDADYCHLYSYGFENISRQRQIQKTADTCLATNFLGLSPPHWQNEQQLAEEFSMPPKRCRRIVLLLEIRSARDFEFDQLHVRYHTQLPKSVILEEGLLGASTHTSKAQAEQLHHLGHCWQLTLLCEEDYATSADLCRIFFEVISIDSWERERIEGYAYCCFAMETPTSRKTENLICLRPVESFMEHLERFFIGGRKAFDYVSFFLGENIAKNEDQQKFQRTLHSRYGCRMQRTGELIVSYQQFTQRNCELLHPCSHRKSGMTLDDIMLAYREARKRLEAMILK